MNKNLCVVGLGYIGLPTSAMFAKAGYHVTGVDVNPFAIEMINQGKIHIEEVGLGELVKEMVEKGRLKASIQPTHADAYIIAVPTPHNEDHTANLDYVIEATKSIMPFVNPGNVIIVESTIPPRTIDDVVAPIFEKNGWVVGEDIYLAHCPERVLPGRILIELVENTRIVGGINNISTNKAAELYRSFVTGQILKTTAVTAEMSKLMENTYRDVNIALANELVKISQELDVNALDVIRLANHHPRVNLHLPGPGVGGHCLAVDPYFIIEKAPEQSVLISDSRRINNSMPVFVKEQIEKIVPSEGKVAVLGITYKGNIDDVRESPAMTIVDLLLAGGYNVAVHDPHVHQQQVAFSLYDFEEAIIDADCILVLTDHNEFRKLDEISILKYTKNPVILDTRNCVECENSEVTYINFNNLYKLKELEKSKKQLVNN
ncbi:nucleotide sugar dehydrogenase [Bacillus nitratireducens]|uniref:nucleotide sugar dehydrogenase n=1 Tax=Bacillus nitratireducens TaxID=2026193 RepID=UPI003394E53A